MVRNWKPGVDMYIDVSVIDPTGQQWRSDLVSGGAGEAARQKEVKKREYYSNHFNLADQTHIFTPFIIEAQGCVGESALKLIKAMLKKKRELNLRSTSLKVEKGQVVGGEILKKIVFESQRQMAKL